MGEGTGVGTGLGATVVVGVGAGAIVGGLLVGCGSRGRGRCTLSGGIVVIGGSCKGWKPGGGCVGTLGSGTGNKCGEATLGGAAMSKSDGGGRDAARLRSSAICMYAFFVVEPFSRYGNAFCGLQRICRMSSEACFK